MLLLKHILKTNKFSKSRQLNLHIIGPMRNMLTAATAASLGLLGLCAPAVALALAYAIHLKMNDTDRSSVLPSEEKSETLKMCSSTGTFVWTLEGFSLLPSTTGRYVCSNNFVLLGNTWCVSLYANGCDKASDGYVTMYLENKGTKAVTVQYTFAIGDKNGKAPYHSFSSSGPKEFSGAGRGGDALGRRRFIERSAILNSKNHYLQDDTLRIKFTLVQSTKVGQSMHSQAAPSAGLPSLAAQMAQLLASGQNSDVIFLVGNNSIAAHRAILCARSPLLPRHVHASHDREHRPHRAH